MDTRRLDLKLRAGFLALLAVGFVVAALGPAQQALEQRRAIESEQQKLAALRSTNIQLDEELARLSDQEYLEKAAREQLGLVRPGETSYIVERPVAQPEPKVGAVQPESWHERAWEWVRSIFR